MKERNVAGWQFPATDLFPKFFNTGTRDGTFQLFRKKNSLKLIIKRSANMYESSGSQFFRTTTGIQPRILFIIIQEF